MIYIDNNAKKAHNCGEFYMKIFTWKQRVLVFVTTILVVSVFALVGYIIGRVVDNIPLLIMISVLVSYPFSLFALTHVMKRDYEKRSKKEELSKN